VSGHDPAPSLGDVGVDVVVVENGDADGAPFTSPSPLTSTSTARVAESSPLMWDAPLDAL
jgi:hypothetical protein